LAFAFFASSELNIYDSSSGNNGISKYRAVMTFISIVYSMFRLITIFSCSKFISRPIRKAFSDRAALFWSEFICRWARTKNYLPPAAAIADENSIFCMIYFNSAAVGVRQKILITSNMIMRNAYDIVAIFFMVYGVGEFAWRLLLMGRACIKISHMMDHFIIAPTRSKA